MNFELDYSELIFLDAEDLAEGGIRTAYQALTPKLKAYIQDPEEITEMMDHDAPSYAVRHRDVEYLIYGPDLPDKGGQSWGNAAVALFSIVNVQLVNTPYRFYAINGGHDLGGMFLTPEQCEAAKKSLKKKTDWPYLPSAELSWYGQHH